MNKEPIKVDGGRRMSLDIEGRAYWITIRTHIFLIIQWISLSNSSWTDYLRYCTCGEVNATIFGVRIEMINHLRLISDVNSIRTRNLQKGLTAAVHIEATRLTTLADYRCQLIPSSSLRWRKETRIATVLALSPFLFLFLFPLRR